MTRPVRKLPFDECKAVKMTRACAVTGIPPSTMREKIRTGEVRSWLVGPQRLLSVEDILSIFARPSDPITPYPAGPGRGRKKVAAAAPEAGVDDIGRPLTPDLATGSRPAKKGAAK